MGNNHISFTAPKVDRLTSESGKAQTFYWDTKTPTLGVRVTAKGSKSYIFEAWAWSTNESIRTTIGSVDTWTLFEAQSEARRLKVLVDQGVDPRDLAREMKAQSVVAATAKVNAIEVWEEFIEDRKRNWGVRQLENYRLVVRPAGGKITRGLKPGMSPTKQAGTLRSLLSRPLNEITREEVAKWLKKETPKRPTWTRLAFALLRAFVTWANDQKKYKGLVHPDACQRQELPKSNAKDDCLQKEQLSDWFKGVQTLDNPVISAYLQMLLLTGARREELATLKWEDIDLRWNTMIIKDKVEGTRQIPVTPYVARLLIGLQRLNEFAFYSETAKTKHIREPRLAHNKALQKVGLPHLSIQGLRRSFGTLAEWVECPAGISAQVMGHKPSALAEKHYRKRPIDMLRMWHTKIEKFILDEADIEQPMENPERLSVVNNK